MRLTSFPLARAAIVTAVVFALVLASDLLLGREGISRIDLMLVGDLLAAVAVGALYFIHTARVQERQRQLERKLRIVAEMNHHIRNALQPLLYLSGLTDDAKHAAMMRDSVEHIEWALHEILPCEEDPPATAGNNFASARIDKIHAPE